jgi:hypothetical protein
MLATAPMNTGYVSDTKFVNSLDVEQHVPSQAREIASTPSQRRAFGFAQAAAGVLAVVAFVTLAAFQAKVKYSHAGHDSNHGMVNAFAPTGISPRGGQKSTRPVSVVSVPAQHLDAKEREEQRRLITQMATAKDGSAMRAAVAMLANDKEKAAEFCYGLPGALPPMGNFDPAGLSEKPELDVRYYREAELTHGRVGMLASLGFLVQEKFHPLFTADGGPAIEQIPQLPPALWFGMTLGIGICESIRIQAAFANPFEGAKPWSIKEGHTPGDIGFDPLGLKPTDPEEFKTMREKELNNGRLAMIAAAGFMAQEAVTGTTWSDGDIR